MPQTLFDPGRGHRVPVHLWARDVSPETVAQLERIACRPYAALRVAAMADAQANAWGNPSSIHADGRAARAVIEDAREAVGKLTESDPRDVVLTSGGTEANNIALRTAFPAGACRTLVTSRLEHPSIVRVAEALDREGRARIGAGLELAHVVADAGQAFQAAVAIQEILHVRRRHALFRDEVEHDAGIELARPRSLLRRCVF